MEQKKRGFTTKQRKGGTTHAKAVPPTNKKPTENNSDPVSNADKKKNSEKGGK